MYSLLLMGLYRGLCLLSCAHSMLSPSFIKYIHIYIIITCCFITWNLVVATSIIKGNLHASSTCGWTLICLLNAVGLLNDFWVINTVVTIECGLSIKIEHYCYSDIIMITWPSDTADHSQLPVVIPCVHCYQLLMSVKDRPISARAFNMAFGSTLPLRRYDLLMTIESLLWTVVSVHIPHA